MIPLTTNLDRTRFPFTELIAANPTSGLKHQSVALVFQIRAVSVSRIRNLIGCIATEEMERIDGQVSGLLSL